MKTRSFLMLVTLFGSLCASAEVTELGGGRCWVAGDLAQDSPRIRYAYFPARTAGTFLPQTSQSVIESALAKYGVEPQIGGQDVEAWLNCTQSKAILTLGFHSGPTNFCAYGELGGEGFRLLGLTSNFPNEVGAPCTGYAVGKVTISLKEALTPAVTASVQATGVADSLSYHAPGKLLTLTLKSRYAFHEDRAIATLEASPAIKEVALRIRAHRNAIAIEHDYAKVMDFTLPEKR